MKTILQKEIETDEGGAWLKCYVPNFNKIRNYFKNDLVQGNLELIDQRIRSLEQLRKYWALVGDIEFHTGYPKLQLSDTFKVTYSEIKGLDPSEISLSTIDMTSLYELINLVLDWCMTYDISISGETGLMFRDLEQWYYYLAHKKECFICGGGEEDKSSRHTHHIDKIGMGHNRNKVIHEGRRAMILCGPHHDEYHTIGHRKFLEKYHIQMITLTEELVKELGI